MKNILLAIVVSFGVAGSAWANDDELEPIDAPEETQEAATAPPPTAPAPKWRQTRRRAEPIRERGRREYVEPEEAPEPSLMSTAAAPLAALPPAAPSVNTLPPGAPVSLPPPAGAPMNGRQHEVLLFFPTFAICQWTATDTVGPGVRPCRPGDYGYATPTTRSGYDNANYGEILRYADSRGITSVPAYLPGTPEEQTRGISHVWNHQGCRGTPDGHHVCWTRDQVATYWQCGSGPSSNMFIVLWQGMNFRMKHIREGSETEDTYLVDNQYSIDRGLCNSYCRQFPARRGCQNFNR